MPLSSSNKHWRLPQNEQRKKNDKFLQQNLKSKGRATQGVGDSNSSFTEGKKRKERKKSNLLWGKCKSKLKLPTPTPRSNREGHLI